MTEKHNEKEIQASFDKNIMKRLMTYAKPHKFAFILCILLIFIVTAIDLMIPLFTKVAIDEYIAPEESLYYSYPLNNHPDLENFQIPEFPNQTFIAQVTLNQSVNQGLDKLTNQGTSNLENASLTNASTGSYRLLSDQNPAPYTLEEIDTAQVTPIDKTSYDLLKTPYRQGLILLSVAMLFLVVSAFIFNFIQVYVLNRSSQKIVYTMRESLFDHLENMHLAFFDNNPVGRLVTRVTNDMKNINEMFVNVLVTSLKDLALLGGTVFVMFSIDAKLSLAAFITLPFILIAAYIFRIKARDIQREVKVKLAHINATLAEYLSGMKIIQIFNQEDRLSKDFKKINEDFYKTSMKETKIYAIFRPSMNLAYSISLAAILWYGGGQAIQGVIELGVLVAFISYIQQFFRPIFDLTEKFNIFQSSMASSERIFMLMDEENPIKNPQSPQPLGDNLEGAITFEDVRFSYTQGQEILKGISFKAKPGETIALVGATGSGKTTIINLLNRFYDIQEGAITIDEKDIRSLDKKDLRRHIGIVLQDVFLFSGDIKSNIRLNNSDITDEDIVDISKFVNAHDFISKLPRGYEEPVVERGATLSSGQRQLISFARALAFDPKILILDEATSNIDTETEHLIQDAITKLIKNRTTIIVAHRLSTIQHADQIIVMHKGEIKEIGNHESLLKKEGMYYDLYRLQYQ